MQGCIYYAQHSLSARRMEHDDNKLYSSMTQDVSFLPLKKKVTMTETGVGPSYTTWDPSKEVHDAPTSSCPPPLGSG
jgi:hypothetical protein